MSPNKSTTFWEYSAPPPKQINLIACHAGERPAMSISMLHTITGTKNSKHEKFIDSTIAIFLQA
jgi:hypothetical protein